MHPELLTLMNGSAHHTDHTTMTASGRRHGQKARWHPRYLTAQMCATAGVPQLMQTLNAARFMRLRHVAS
eukprot:364848-Chlamydomonas_euryale.AAC.16